MDLATKQILGTVFVLALFLFVFWLVGKVLWWLFELSCTGPLWARIILWPYMILVKVLIIWAVAEQTREVYRWMNKPRD